MNSRSCTTCINENCILKKCTPEWQDFIDKHRRIIHIKRKQLVFQEGDISDAIYFINEGIIKVYKTGLNDRIQIIRFSKFGTIIGHRAWNRPHFPISAQALTDAVVCVLSKNDFEIILKNNVSALYALTKFYANELYNSETKMKSFSLTNVHEKLAYALLSLAEQFGKDKTGFIPVLLTRKEIGEYASTTEKQVSKVLSEFASEKVIELSGKKIKLVNLEYLKYLVNGKVLKSAYVQKKSFHSKPLQSESRFASFIND